jgi:hypothetical protein
MPKLREVPGGGGQTENLLSEDHMSELRPGSARDRQIGSDEGWKSSKTTEVFLKKSCISYQFRADVQRYGHRHRFRADNDAAETTVRS